MKHFILILAALFLMTGCQKSSQPQQGVPNKERQEAAKKYFAQSILMLQNKDLKGAVQSLEASIKTDPSDPNPYLMLGQILINAGQYEQGVIFLDQTAKKFPDNASVFYMLSLCNRMSGKILPAVLTARRSFEIFKASGDIDNAKTSAILLQELIKEAQEQEQGSTEKTLKTVGSKQK